MKICNHAMENMPTLPPEKGKLSREHAKNAVEKEEFGLGWENKSHKSNFFKIRPMGGLISWSRG